MFIPALTFSALRICDSCNSLASFLPLCPLIDLLLYFFLIWFIATCVNYSVGQTPRPSVDTLSQNVFPRMFSLTFSKHPHYHYVKSIVSTYWHSRVETLFLGNYSSSRCVVKVVLRGVIDTLYGTRVWCSFIQTKIHDVITIQNSFIYMKSQWHLWFLHEINFM